MPNAGLIVLDIFIAFGQQLGVMQGYAPSTINHRVDEFRAVDRCLSCVGQRALRETVEIEVKMVHGFRVSSKLIVATHNSISSLEFGI